MQITMICSVIMFSSLRHRDERKDPLRCERSTYRLQFWQKTGSYHVVRAEEWSLLCRE